jgi:hypothetical protein
MKEEQQQVADAIIAFLKTLNGLLTPVSAIVSKLEQQTETVQYVVSILCIKGLLHKTQPIINGDRIVMPELYFLSGKGWIYTMYEDLLIKEKETETRIQQKEILDIENIKASIDTNKSIKTVSDKEPERFTSHKRLTISAIIVAGASALFTLASVYVNINDTTSKELQQIRTLLQRQVQILDSMQKSQKGIDSSLRKAVKDSFYQQHR